MKKFISKSSDNAGYSLIELIVTVLISSVIMLAVVGFLTTGLRHYQNVNAETALQTESQVAELFISELIQEATDFEIYSASAYSAHSDISYAIRVDRGGKSFVLTKKGTELWYGEVDGSKTAAEQVSELVAKGRDKTFLAKYVTDFSVNGGGATKMADVVKGNGFVALSITFQTNQREYASSSLITLRNTTMN